MVEEQNKDKAIRRDPEVLRCSEEIHSRVFSMIYPSDKRKAFKSADAVIRFLFQQYDERVKENSGLRTKDKFIVNIPLEAVKDAGLNIGDELQISVEGNKIILEKKTTKRFK